MAVQLAFAGAGLIAAVHRDAVDHLDGVAISSVASRDPRRAAEAARHLGVPATTYAELPGAADGVVICTAPSHHADQALAVMAAGVPVLVEKPLCTTLAQADALVAAEAAGGRLAYAENLLHAPAVRLALAHATQLEGIDIIEVRAVQPRPTWGEFLSTGWGGGVLFDLGVHQIALALLLAAPARPIEVRASLEGSDDHPVDEHAEVSILFDDDAHARVVASWRATDQVVWDAQASSPDGVVRLELLPEVLLERNGAEVRLPDPPEGIPEVLDQLGYLDQMSEFVQVVRDGRAPLLGASFGRSVLDLTCAAYASAGAGGEWLPLPFSGSRHLTPHQLWRGPS